VVFRLPVSGIDVGLNELSGADELAILETPARGARLAFEAATRLTVPLSPDAPQWTELPVADLEIALLRIRQVHFGDVIRSGVNCTAAGCAATIEIEFSIDEFIAHHQPRSRLESMRPDDEGWLKFDDSVSFRIPTVGDQIAIAGAVAPKRQLIDRCVRPLGLGTRALRKIERALEALSPTLSGALTGRCPQCGAAVDIEFDPQEFVLLEIRGQAGFVFDDIHLIALHYHWPEPEILALPRGRRIRYAEMVRSFRSAA